MEVPPGLLARTTEASSTVTGSNFFPPRFNVSRFSNHDGDSGQNVPFLIKKTEFPFFQTGSRLLQVALQGELGACLHGGGGHQVGEVTRLSI